MNSREQGGWLITAIGNGVQSPARRGRLLDIWALQLSGIGTTLTGINFFVTILKMRAPGMTMFKMPVFTGLFCARQRTDHRLFPDSRRLPSRCFDPGSLSGHPFLYQHYGRQHDVHQPDLGTGPSGYILILPVFGVFSKIAATFSARKRLFGYTSLVWATVCITVLSFIVWLHHFFTMGAGANVSTSSVSPP